jgi:E3 ubiquitin-protein ligase CCNP1IP1
LLVRLIVRLLHWGANNTRHIFCHDCAASLGLSHPTTRNRHCPACQTVLLNPDDAVSTVLNPTEDYKTSVLSGLDPNTIMECAGRALGFWAYQSTQEMYGLVLRSQAQLHILLHADTAIDSIRNIEQNPLQTNIPT